MTACVFNVFSGWAKTCQQDLHVFENKIRDIEWATQNCTLSFNTAGKYITDIQWSTQNSVLSCSTWLVSISHYMTTYYSAGAILKDKCMVSLSFYFITVKPVLVVISNHLC